MWRSIRARPLPRLRWGTAAAVSTLALFGSVVANDSRPGVVVDSAIDPFPLQIKASEPYKLVASGVRLVTFIGFKVYGVGVYMSTNVLDTIKKWVTQTGRSAEELLNDKSTSMDIVAEISRKPYLIKITPVRNTDFGHLRDGFVKSILASPYAKHHKEEVAQGIAQLRAVFQGYKGSVPKNHSLLLECRNGELSFTYEGKTSEEMGKVTVGAICEVLLVLYLSSAKPLSEPLRKDFVNAVVGEV